MSVNFEPIFTRIVVKREESALERKLDNAGLITPDNTKSSYQSSEGVLIKAGEDCCERVKELIGKKILFAKYSGDDLPEDWFGDDDQYVLMDEADIFGERK